MDHTPPPMATQREDASLTGTRRRNSTRRKPILSATNDNTKTWMPVRKRVRGDGGGAHRGKVSASPTSTMKFPAADGGENGATTIRRNISIHTKIDDELAMGEEWYRPNEDLDRMSSIEYEVSEEWDLATPHAPPTPTIRCQLFNAVTRGWEQFSLTLDKNGILTHGCFELTRIMYFNDKIDPRFGRVGVLGIHSSVATLALRYYIPLGAQTEKDMLSVFSHILKGNYVHTRRCVDEKHGIYNLTLLSTISIITRIVRKNMYKYALDLDPVYGDIITLTVTSYTTGKYVTVNIPTFECISENYILVKNEGLVEHHDYAHQYIMFAIELAIIGKLVDVGRYSCSREKSEWMDAFKEGNRVAFELATDRGGEGGEEGEGRSSTPGKC